MLQCHSNKCDVTARQRAGGCLFMKRSLERLFLGMENSSASQKPLSLNYQYISVRGWREKTCKTRAWCVAGITRFPLLSLCRYWLTNKVHIKRPTTGLLMYTLATRFCNQIYLYGFWPFPLDQNQNPVKYHYYDSLKYGYTSQASPHTMPLEFKALKTLHQQGALKLTVGECDGAT